MARRSSFGAAGDKDRLRADLPADPLETAYGRELVAINAAIAGHGLAARPNAEAKLLPARACVKSGIAEAQTLVAGIKALD